MENLFKIMPKYPTKNLGYIPQIRPTDYLAGTLPYQVVIPSGDWRPYLPQGENQYSQVADSMSCVSFSNNNAAEISLKQQGITVNFSDRFLAKLSNTTPQGNTFGVVADTARHFGRVDEEQWGIPNNFTWDSFYQPVPENVLKQAIFYDEQYEFITDLSSLSLQYQLRQAPLQIAIPSPIPNHAVVLVYVEGSTGYYFDSYPGSTNYLKTVPINKISAALKLIIKPKQAMPEPKFFKVNDHGKLGIMVLEGLTGIILFEDKMQDYVTLQQITSDKFASAQTINIP